MNNKNELFHKIYKILFYVLTSIVGLLFILFAYTIYFKGKEMIASNPTYQIYTKDIISKYLGYIMLPFILWILLVIGGNILYLVYPNNASNKFKLDPYYTNVRLNKKLKLNNTLSNVDLVYKERKFRNLILLGSSIISLLCMVYPAIYLFNFNNFPGNNTNKEIINLFLNSIPFIILSFIVFFSYFIFSRKSLIKENQLLQEYLRNKENINQENNNVSKFYDSPLFAKVVQLSVITISVIFIILGIFKGGVEGVLNKAINICTECIGLA